MYSKSQLALKYLRYFITASNGKGHGVHSPFVFNFIHRVLNDDRQFYAYQPVENLRRLLMMDQRELQIEDFGAESKERKYSFRKVSEIAKSSLKSTKYDQLLFRIVDYYAPEHMLALGSSLGITSAYLAMANPQASLTTMEDSTAISNVAKENFQKLGIKNLRLVEGDFDIILPSWLKQGRQIDLVFIGGNHRCASMLEYFTQLLKHINENSILIFNDIHRSKEMEEVWKKIQDHSSVTLSIDLFSIGIVFFRKEFKVKQHIAIRF